MWVVRQHQIVIVSFHDKYWALTIIYLEEKSFDYLNWGSSRYVNREIPLLHDPFICFQLDWNEQTASGHGGPSTGWCCALGPLPTEWLCCTHLDLDFWNYVSMMKNYSIRLERGKLVPVKQRRNLLSLWICDCNLSVFWKSQYRY